jgi:hypothetical protein
MTRTALQKGQRRYRQDQRREAVQRVKAYKRGIIPATPSGRELRMAREAGR